MATAGGIEKAFNGELDLETAWKYDYQGVLNFMDRVAKDPKKHGVAPEWQEPGQNYLGNLYQGMVNLRCDKRDLKPGQPKEHGVDFAAPGKQQHTRRKDAEPATLEDPLSVRPYVFPGGHVLSSIYDILGAFLSLARAPIAATRTNFYLPWTVLYCRWVNMFVQGRANIYGNGGKPPGMYQCTWRIEFEEVEVNGRKRSKRAQSRFFIGISLAGFAQLSDEAVEVDDAWVTKVQKARFHHLADTNGMVDRFQYGNAPNFEAKTDGEASGWNFGNCAETHPFVDLVQNIHQDQRNRCYGFALKPVIVNKVMKKAAYTMPVQLTLPCSNCTLLIRQVYHCVYEQFDPENALSDPAAPEDGA